MKKRPIRKKKKHFCKSHHILEVILIFQFLNENNWKKMSLGRRKRNIFFITKKETFGCDWKKKNPKNLPSLISCLSQHA